MKNVIIIIGLLITTASWSQDFKMSDQIPNGDSTTQAFLQEQILNRINEYRLEKGVPALRLDTVLAPAAHHHAEYMNRVNELTHDETVDLPNFTEYKWPSSRLKLLDTKKIWRIAEELLSDLILFNHSQFTFEYMVEHTTTNGYKTCPGHWHALMSAEYDCAYVLYDMSKATDSGCGVTCIIILGVSSDPYKTQLGIPVN